MEYVSKKDFFLLNANLNRVLDSIKEELDDHLQAINENTDEINENHSFLCELDAKILKLNERIDDLQLMLTKIIHSKNSIELTEDEQKIFLVLYTFGEETLLSYADIASKLNMPEFYVRKLLVSMVMKGVPVIEKQIGSDSFFELDSRFKEDQIKNQIIKIDEKLSKEILVF